MQHASTCCTVLHCCIQVAPHPFLPLLGTGQLHRPQAEYATLNATSCHWTLNPWLLEVKLFLGDYQMKVTLRWQVLRPRHDSLISVRPSQPRAAEACGAAWPALPRGKVAKCKEGSTSDWRHWRLRRSALAWYSTRMSFSALRVLAAARLAAGGRLMLAPQFRSGSKGSSKILTSGHIRTCSRVLARCCQVDVVLYT